jgi:hypothetical protein
MHMFARSIEFAPFLRFFYWLIIFDLLRLTPLSAIFQLYHGDQF